MPSLRDLQHRFAAAIVADAAEGDARVAVYRNAVRANYRNALGATYRVVRELTGAPFFNAAVDAYARAHRPRAVTSTCTAERSATFSRRIRTRAISRTCPTSRASNGRSTKPTAPATATARRSARSPTSRASQATPLRRCASRSIVVPPAALAVPDPAHLAGAPGGLCGRRARAIRRGTDFVLVTRDATGVGAQRVAGGEFAWLAALLAGADLAAALDAALAADATFDLAPRCARGSPTRRCCASPALFDRNRARRD